MTDMDPAIMSAIIAVAGAGGTAIKMLWNRMTSASEATEKALSECKDDHKKADEKFDVLYDKLTDLSRTVGKFEGRILGLQEAEAIRAAHDEEGKKS
jgi:hypothetical protein